MGRRSSVSRGNPLAYGADWLASWEAVPLSVRAVFGYYADTGLFDYRSIRVKSYVDDTIEGIVDAAFAAIERNLAAAFDEPAVEFRYETKLTLPAELTLGYLYRRILERAPAGFNPITGRAASGVLPFGGNDTPPPEAQPAGRRELVEEVATIERVTELVVAALIDGDMRDALNDEEYDDFDVDFDAGGERRRVAEIAQETLEASIEDRLGTFPAAVADAYRTAVEVSERHQAMDEQFRALLARHAGDAIRERYKFAAFESPPDLFGEDDRSIPYFKTQYDRVGVIYDGMVDMYRGADLAITDDFKRAIVLSIIGAQIWLDDVSDYADDRRAGQLTPVTAEYALAASDREAYEAVVETAERYLDRAKAYATRSGTPMLGIAVEYIYRKGEPDRLPR